MILCTECGKHITMPHPIEECDKSEEHEHKPRIVGNADWISGGLKFDVECTVKGCNKRGWAVYEVEPYYEWHD